MEQLACISPLIHSNLRPFSGWTPMDSYVVEMLDILDSLFHKVVNTTSNPMGVEGRGWWGATKWQDLPIQKLFYGLMASIQAIFSSKCHKM